LQERGFWSTPNEDVNGVQYIITHEIGHGAFESTPIIGQTGFNHFDDYCSDHPEEVAKISKYAMYSHEEAKAETYAAIKGGNPKYAKLPIVKQFKREYAKQNGKELR
jgi:hypothetical protein